jgi:hypothetical protein
MTVRTGWLDEADPNAVADLTHTLPVDVPVRDRSVDEVGPGPGARRHPFVTAESGGSSMLDGWGLVDCRGVTPLGWE